MTVIDTINTALADRCHVEQSFVAGGMATVYPLGTCDTTARSPSRCCILSRHCGRGRTFPERDQDHRKAYPHILPLLDSGAANGLLFYVIPTLRAARWRARSRTHISLASSTATSNPL